jgi:hypothetical protein
MASGEERSRPGDTRLMADQRGRLAARVHAHAADDHEVNLAAGPSSDGEAGIDLVGLCCVPDCYDVGVQEILSEQNVRWASGRQLMGMIVHRSRICEAHFELLVRGHNVP